MESCIVCGCGQLYQNSYCMDANCPAKATGVNRLQWKEKEKAWFLDGKKVKNPPPQFTADDLTAFSKKEQKEEDAWGFFYENLASESLFPYDFDNNEVLDRLHKAGVLAESDDADSEAGEVFINFVTQKDALAFLDRLNAYLRKRWWAIKELKRQLRELP